MSGGATTNLVIGLFVLALLVSRQLTTRRLRENYQLLIILAVVGVIQFVTFLNGHPHHDGAIAAAVVGSLVLAAVLGAVRAPTVRVWRAEDGQLLRRGTWLTAALWVVALGAHLGYDYLVAGHVTGKNGGNVGDATVVLYLVVSLAVQRYIMLARAARQDAAGQIPAGEPRVPL
jgi:peptidoglycan/LPS O-acetylase OafA/YrhL